MVHVALEMDTKFCLENVMGKDHLGNLRLGRYLNGLNWLWIWPSWSLL